MRLSPSQSHLLLALPAFVAVTLATNPAADLANPAPIGNVADLHLNTPNDFSDGIASREVLPADGKDGKPHNGPWVETSGGQKDGSGANGQPHIDVAILDGQRIPTSNDGVMDDPNRHVPTDGERGTEGGVSEKTKSRLGEQAANQPEPPKEVPPLPNSEEAKISKDSAAAPPARGGSDVKHGIDDDSLPDRILERPSLADDAGENSNQAPGDTTPSSPHGVDHGLVQPLHSVILSLTMILVSEVGDKTFLVAALMAMKHDRMLVFSAAFSALLVMTVLSAVLGHAVPTLLSKRLTSFLACALFFVFGVRLLREGLAMSPNEGVTEELQEVERELSEKEKDSPHALEMGIGRRRSRSKNRFPAPPRSPSTSPSRSGSTGSTVTEFFSGLQNLLSLVLSPAWVQTFVMTFLGEWGDRSQIATIAMAAGQDYWWVTIGAMAGHCVCTGIAVIGGRAIAGRVSMKKVTIGGAIAFLVFGVLYLFEALSG